ncbi:hypothetical protein GF367_02365 [Candidatus Woesearchaeota archaeon]|nr:hypothetical protein [Candidatus Woesearchaeota archaeon]
MPEQKDDVKELLHQLKLVKEEAAQIKKRLSAVGQDKEKWFNKKRDISSQIKEKISTVKEAKGERNSFTEEVKKAKEERDTLNKQITVAIKEIKRMKDAYKAMAEKHGVKGNPADIKKRIERLEYWLQTEPMKFDKEQKVMKEIKDLKKKYEEFKDVQQEWEAVVAKSKEIDKLKKRANEYHRVVQQAAKQSQAQHEHLLVDSKEIDELKKSEEEAYQKFFEYKTKFKDVNAELKPKLKELQAIKEELDSHNVALREEKQQREQKTLKEKAAEVEEKVKQRKKLTTEDLLVMQRSQNKKTA